MLLKNKWFIGGLFVLVGWVAMRSLCMRQAPGSERLATASALLNELNIAHENNLQSINSACQQHLLRKPGVERWQIENDLEAAREKLMPYFQKMGMCDEFKPSVPLAEYDYIVFLGATTERTIDRISYIKDELQSLPVGTKPLVVLLTGMRPLDPTHEDLSYGSTEVAMMEGVYKALGLAEHPYLVINAPMKGSARPTTDDTVQAWLAHQPKPGRCLVISNQPFVQRQTDVLRALLPKDFTVEGVGPAATTSCSVVIYLDELARTVYQAKIVAEKNK